MSLRKERRELKVKEKKLEKSLATAIANKDSLEDDLVQAKKDRARLKHKKTKGVDYDAEQLKKYNTEIRDINSRLTRVRKNIKQRRTWIKKVKNSIIKKTKQIRKKSKPKIIDLELDFKAMSIQGNVNKVIGHYTAGPVDKDTKDAIRLCKLYHQAHLNQGWSGEAYMLCFTRDGNILLLRPSKYVGAHTLGQNSGSYGIMMHGSTGDKPTEAQKKALRWWAKNGHKNIMGKCKTQQAPEKYKWYGHNDFNATSCPGNFKTAYITKGTN